MGYRNETEALRAKVVELEGELARLKGRRPTEGDHKVKRQTILVWLVAALLTLGVVPCALMAWIESPQGLDPAPGTGWIDSHEGELVRFEAELDVPHRAREARGVPQEPGYDDAGYDEYEYDYYVPLAGEPRVLVACDYACGYRLRGQIRRAVTDERTLHASVTGRPRLVRAHEPDPRLVAYASAHEVPLTELVVVDASRDDATPLIVMVALAAFATLVAWLMVFVHRKLASRVAALPAESDQRIRGPHAVWLLALATCHLYVPYWQWVTTAQLRRLTGRADLIPAVDLVMTFLTLGLWRFWIAWRNSEAIDEALRARGEITNAANDTLLWGVITFAGCGLAEYVLFYKLQEAINRLALEEIAGEPSPESSPQV
ncbi:MAG: hypothetical protein K8H88_21290 [Sandaracinaceae bacterium]|nr:hypothetical protein [Sandaracinaceae bacterium]